MMNGKAKTVGKIITAPIWGPWKTVRSLKGTLKCWIRSIRAFFTEEPEVHPLPDIVQRATEHPDDLWVHFAALRRHIFRAVAFWILATALSLAFVSRLMTFLAGPIGGLEHLQAIEVTEPIGVVLRVALLAGFSVSLPYIYFELYLFAAPGLRPRTRVYGLLGMPLVLLFFMAGMAFAYYVMLPAALPFLLNFMGIPTVPRPASYIRFVTGLLFWVGVAFEFPLIVFLLASVGWIKAEQLVRHWRIAIVLIAVLAAIITPTVDPINMLLVMGPMIVLYLLGIFLARVAYPGRSEKRKT